MPQTKPHWLNAWLKPKPELQRAPENDRLSRMAIESDPPPDKCSYCGGEVDSDGKCYDYCGEDDEDWTPL